MEQYKEQFDTTWVDFRLFVPDQEIDFVYMDMIAIPGYRVGPPAGEIRLMGARSVSITRKAIGKMLTSL